MPSDIYQADPPHRPLPGDGAREQPRQQQPDNGTDSGAWPLPLTGRPRTGTADTAEIDETLSHPGSVRINVKGAFIVDQDTATPTTPDGRSGSPGRHETKDIRLPNHTAVVSHIAVDVRPSPKYCSPCCDDVIVLLPAGLG
jgi:type II pantothenate kinase